MNRTIELNENCISVLGMGNGGHAFAAYGKSRGYKVKIWNRSKKTLKSIKKNKGIITTGVIDDHFHIDKVTNSIKEVLTESKLILIVTTADAHKEIAEKIAPYLEEDQYLVLNPGRTGGALEVTNILKQKGGINQPKVAEAQSLLFVSRLIGEAKVLITKKKKKLPVASFPFSEMDGFMDLLKPLNSSFTEADTVLQTSFDNIGAIFHPAPLLLNVARCEDPKINYRHYIDGISPSVAKFLERLGQERIQIAKEYGIEATPIDKWLKNPYGSKGKTLYEKLHNTDQYADVLAPKTLSCRYIFEDVPTGLVPLVAFGEFAGVKTPYLKTIINLANCMLDKDYYRTGRSLESMGLSQIPSHILKEYVTFGEEAFFEGTDFEVVIED
ncbi:MAG: NAD/NADP octopine/nopaline dehydrogenase family protein [Candidatus Hodarchaeales archaeon]